MDLQRPSVYCGQQTFSLCTPFSIKQQQLILDHTAREKYYKKQTLNYTTSGRQDRQKPPPLEFTEQLGGEVELYGRVFKILDCDEFTRRFCANAGHELGEAAELPEDTFFRSFVMKQRDIYTPPPAVLNEIRAAKAFAEASRGNTCSNKLLQQYLDNDRRGKLPKQLGELTWSDYQLSRDEIYTPEDFAVGKQIEVYGRKFYLYDCDEFTRQFYREYMNIEQGSEVIPDEKPTPKRPHPNEREILFGEDMILNFKASQIFREKGRKQPTCDTAADVVL
ncbi:hypothetical protein, conserved [Eimeria brunetti]|uniref:DM10 domain-containing protein n=1 Tax=Eimeria brunetti TaxID=51314 RepID=U6LSX7_9EIME|nr:hypothetical protein, conserved [Eimeria brunetti]